MTMLDYHDTEICAVCGKKRWERIGDGAWQCACDCAVILDDPADDDADR